MPSKNLIFHTLLNQNLNSQVSKQDNNLLILLNFIHEIDNHIKGTSIVYQEK